VAVVGVPPTTSGSTRITVGEATVVVVSIALGEAPATTVVGISIDGWITWFLTCETAPNEKATATMAATTQLPANFIQLGMTQLLQLLR
jgi:hypothetical protein